MAMHGDGTGNRPRSGNSRSGHDVVEQARQERTVGCRVEVFGARKISGEHGQSGDLGLPVDERAFSATIVAISGAVRVAENDHRVFFGKDLRDSVRATPLLLSAIEAIRASSSHEVDREQRDLRATPSGNERRGECRPLALFARALSRGIELGKLPRDEQMGARRIVQKTDLERALPATLRHDRMPPVAERREPSREIHERFGRLDLLDRKHICPRFDDDLREACHVGALPTQATNVVRAYAELAAMAPAESKNDEEHDRDQKGELTGRHAEKRGGSSRSAPGHASGQGAPGRLAKRMDRAQRVPRAETRRRHRNRALPHQQTVLRAETAPPSWYRSPMRVSALVPLALVATFSVACSKKNAETGPLSGAQPAKIEPPLATQPSGERAAVGSDAGDPNDLTVPREASAANPAPPSWVDPCPTLGPCRIMPLGDSITYGLGGSGGGYRVPLFRIARRHKRSVLFVGREKSGPATVDGVSFPGGHEGYSGYTVAPCGGREGVTPLVPQALAAAKPHVVLLMIGTNDVAVGMAGAPCATSTLVDRLASLVDTIVAGAPNALLVVASLVPSQDEEFDRRATAYVSQIPKVVSERAGRGQKVVFVDMLPAFQNTADFRAKLFADTLHPNDGGYAVMADVWATALFPKPR